MKITQERMKRFLINTTSLVMIAETNEAIQNGNKKRAIAASAVSVGLDVINFADSLHSIACKEFTKDEIQDGIDNKFYLNKLVKDLMIGPVLNSYLTASSLAAISKME